MEQEEKRVKKTERTRRSHRATGVFKAAVALLLAVSTLAGAFYGMSTVKMVHRVRKLDSRNHFYGKSFETSRTYQELLDGYLQLLGLYMEVERPLLTAEAEHATVPVRKGKKTELEEVHRLEDVPLFQNMDGEVLTYGQLAENAEYDFQGYIDNYLNHLDKYAEEGVSLLDLTEEIRSVDQMMTWYKGDYYYQLENESIGEDGMTADLKEQFTQMIEQIEGEKEAGWYREGAENLLPEFEAEEGSQGLSVMLPLKKTEPKIWLADMYQKWLYQQYPDYLVYETVRQMAEGCLEELAGKKPDTEGYQKYKNLLLADYETAHCIGDLYYGDFYEEYEDNGEFFYIGDEDDDEKRYRGDKEVYINDGTKRVTIRQLHEWYEDGTYDDVIKGYDGKVYDASLSLHASTLKGEAERKLKSLREDEKPWEFPAVPCGDETVTDVAGFYLAFEKGLKEYLEEQPFFYSITTSDAALNSRLDEEGKERISQIREHSGEEKTGHVKDGAEYVYYNDKGALYVPRMYWDGDEFQMTGDLESFLKKMGEGYSGYSCIVGVDLAKIKKGGSGSPFYAAYEQYQADYQKYLDAEHLAKRNFMELCIAAAFMLLSLLLLTVLAGRRAGETGVKLIFLDKVWLEVLAAAFFFCMLVFMDLVENVDTGYLAGGGGELGTGSRWEGYLYLSGLSLTVLAAVILYLSAVRRIKAGKLFDSSLLVRLGRTLVRKVRSFAISPVLLGQRLLAYYKTLKAGKRYLAISVAWLLLWCILGGFWLSSSPYMDDGVMVFGILFGIALLILTAIMLKQSLINARADQMIAEGAEKIAGGDLSYQIPLPEKASREQTGLIHVINRIGEGLERAVEESVKNERMKTELITNVSHDIKTPLTSVISYVDLLKKEVPDNEKVQEYLDVLDKKSQRLKSLIEDLTEASKASSGALELQITNLNFNELVNQTGGEFEDKFEAAGLTVILDIAEETLVIQGDGKRVYRILENLYGNVAKYAMAGTRVYISLKKETGLSGKPAAVFTIRNISRELLDVTAEELTERFVRGDMSRTTEGSGLGLSIAKSLTELMDGSFDIYVEGDLFRVTVSFLLL